MLIRETSIVSINSAGKDFFIGSLILTCIASEPHMISAKVIKEIISSSLNQILNKIKTEHSILINPIK